ncbi:unnamed protein product [Trifolium pratense]|uniref:Uncharacterized protein n=1 Tax=Trifolium pratense TaxID=57577 RepID=A0ACB0JJC5_TRIPR|nr:unnamed protein product [Trifolium pratense]
MRAKWKKKRMRRLKRKRRKMRQRSNKFHKCTSSMMKSENVLLLCATLVVITRKSGSSNIECAVIC